jgi:hypothetical protein
MFLTSVPVLADRRSLSSFGGDWSLDILEDQS